MILKFTAQAALWIILALFLSGCATEYRPFVQPVYATGAGGEMHSLHGMDLWTQGRPPRKFMVIGSIIDNRPSSTIAMCFQGAQVVRLAKEQGGDALILGYDRKGVKWHGGLPSTQITSATSPETLPTSIEREVTKYYVIKYL